MLYYLSRKEIDVEKWDECLLSAHNSTLYGTSTFLDGMADEWSGLVLDDYKAVMPLPFRKKYGIHYLYQPLFAQQFGIYKKDSMREQDVNALLDGIPKKFKYASMNLNPVCFAYKGDKKISTRDNYLLDLNVPYEMLYLLYSDKNKASLKQTKAYQLRAESVVDTWKIIKLFSDNNIKYANRFALTDYERLVKLIEVYSRENKVEQIGVYNQENVLCSGGIFIRYQNKHIFIFSGNSQIGRQQRAMFFLLDHFIKKHAGSRTILDFSGTTDPGLARFYKGFGSSIEQYPRMEFNYLPWPLNVIKK